VHHGVDVSGPHRFQQSFTISDVHLGETHPVAPDGLEGLDRASIATIEIVDDLDGMSGFDESQDRV
jgi:hypothetical protein